MASMTLTVDEELIEDNLSGANLNGDEEVIPPPFRDAMNSIDKLRTHFFSQKNSEKSFNDLYSIHNALLQWFPTHGPGPTCRPRRAY
ncbi:hypothetical protein AVEN_141606-1 [Araneus ventricosus]|uniref:Uncharacterized protein n=1 Tax=Araneus ventricosus TaxID=182803 RepID=A0A4Y2IMT8_ARAVE|nr:hypothetical protein AVEN_141606-1 [Araneus ventricosus]